jgi:hypothetical protein
VFHENTGYVLSSYAPLGKRDALNAYLHPPPSVARVFPAGWRQQQNKRQHDKSSA